MHWKLLAVLALAPVLVDAAGPVAEGRWQGVIEIPGRPLTLTLDLAPAAAGQWQGSVTIPALGIAGVPLRNVVVADGRVTFSLTGSLDSSRLGAASVEARLDSPGALSGRFSQAGHSAPLALQRVGAAQVQPAIRSTAVRTSLEGEWVGQYEMGGYPRNVTIVFRNAAGKGATATFVIVGKQKTELPVDLVVEEGEFVRVESQEYRVTYEARIGAGASELAGVVALGAAEVPLVMRRASDGKR